MSRLDAGAVAYRRDLSRDRTASLAPARERAHDRSTISGFLPAARREEVAAALHGQRWVVARVAAAAGAGRLGAAIDDAVEAALALRGAVPPGVEVDADAEATLRDRLLRVRALDRPGLVLVFPSLEGITDGGRLSAGDSAALMFWIDASGRAPVAVLLDDRDRATVALAPVELGTLLEADAPGEGCPDTDSSPRAMEAPLDPGLRVTIPGIVADDDAPTPLVPPVHFPDPAPSQRATAPSDETIETRRADPMEDDEEEEDDEPTTALAAPVRQPSEPEAEAEPEPAPEAPRAAQPAPELDPKAAQRVISAAEWRNLAVELDAARGPKPARQIDRLFVTRYLPLLGAVARGEVDGAVRGVVDSWRQSFEHSYREGFAALRLTGKRPPMVLDAPEIAAKIGRLNGARSVKLLLVDAMSFDLGQRVMDRLGREVKGRAACVDRTLLWSALPSTTPTQMGLLARGAEGLRDAPPTSEREPDIARGRAITTLRRERIGARELLKLDLVEARLRCSGPAYDARLDAIANEVAPVLARCIDALPPRTLLFVFGDHGFRLPSSADGRTTGPATQGEASPEEIIVPGYALLTGGVH